METTSLPTMIVYTEDYIPTPVYACKYEAVSTIKQVIKLFVAQIAQAPATLCGA